MHLLYSRVGFTKFYAAVNSHVSVAHKSGKPLVFNVLTSPNNMKDLYEGSFDDVIGKNIPLVGPVPFIGASVHCEIGLICMQSENLLKPYMSLLTKLSSTVGVSFISPENPYVSLITEGVNLISGTSKLDIGIVTDFNPIETGYYVILKAKTTEVRLDSVTLGKDLKLYYSNGKELKEFSYMVLQIYGTKNKDDWYHIPDIQVAYQKLQEVEKTRISQNILDTAKAFYLTVLTSNNLLSEDKDVIIAEIQKEVQKLINFGLNSREPVQKLVLKNLRDLNILK